MNDYILQAGALREILVVMDLVVIPRRPGVFHQLLRVGMAHYRADFRSFGNIVPPYLLRHCIASGKLLLGRDLLSRPILISSLVANGGIGLRRHYLAELVGVGGDDAAD